MMILLPGNIDAFKSEVWDNPNQWGWLITPRRSMSKTLGNIPGAKWAADNECYSLGDSFDPNIYIRFLERTSMKWRSSCLFATAPDIVADAHATLKKFAVWTEIIHDIGLPVALVGQDGLESEVIPWSDFETFFVGGSTAWKMGKEARSLIAEANDRGKWVHVGRVNSQTRLRYCIKLGVDSVDGTEWAINPGRGIRWGKMVMETLAYQKELPLCFT
jgi:hypothetical protein